MLPDMHVFACSDDHYSVIDQPTIDESEEKDYYHLLNLQADESVYHDLCTFKVCLAFFQMFISVN